MFLTASIKKCDSLLDKSESGETFVSVISVFPLLWFLKYFLFKNILNNNFLKKLFLIFSHQNNLKI
jgi:hypothetical protein